MNYLTHALAVHPSSDLMFIGSALPDIRHHNFNHLHRPKNSLRFLEYLLENFPDYYDLGLGAFNHQTLDGISNRKGGYFVRAREEAAVFLRENNISALYANLLVDMAVDYHVAQYGGIIIAATNSAWQNADIGELAAVLAPFFSAEKGEIENTLSLYAGIMPRLFDAYKTTEGCAKAASMRISRIKGEGPNIEDFESAFKSTAAAIFMPHYAPLWAAIGEAHKAQALLKAE